MKKISIFCLVIFTTFGSVAHSHFYDIPITTVQENDVITATITKNTTEEQFNELISYFKDNSIELNLSEVKYNEENEIISIKISLEKEGQKSNYGLSSTQPISDIELGYKNNSLFIKSSKGLETSNESLNSLFEELSGGSTSIDSLLTANPFSLSFNSADLQNFINSGSLHFDLDDLAQDFFGQTSTSSSNNTSASKGLPKYNFINTPGIQKLIIIDGKESDFDTLNELAQNNKLEEVDNLKAATAISLYGKKARDGAIIATTKK